MHHPSDREAQTAPLFEVLVFKFKVKIYQNTATKTEVF